MCLLECFNLQVTSGSPDNQCKGVEECTVSKGKFQQYPWQERQGEPSEEVFTHCGVMQFK